MTTFDHFTELANDQVGGQILFTTDDFFAVAEMMLNKDDAVWDAQKYTEFGKWMDGWETRRRRIQGHDWCLLKLGMAGIIKGIEVDTAFFTGNQVPNISIQAACLDHDLRLVRRSQVGTAATENEYAAAVQVKSEEWETIVDMTPLKPGYPETRYNKFTVQSAKRWTHLRINQWPDGGIARLRVYGDVVFDWSRISKNEIIDFASVLCGAKAVKWTDSHYGTPKNLIYPQRATGMYGGWETARNPQRPAKFEKGADGHLIIPGCHWAIIQLGHQMTVKKVEVDTNYFKGNYPESFQLEGVCLSAGVPFNFEDTDQAAWRILVPRTRASAHARHLFIHEQDKHDSSNESENNDFIKFEFNPGNQPITHVRLTMFPDGGISRLRVYGHI